MSPNELKKQFRYSGESSIRLDKFLTNQIPGISRAVIQKLILDDKVRINGNVIDKPSHKLSDEMIIDIVLPEIIETQISPEDISLNVIYSDENTIIINKPAGMVVHPGAGNETGTVVNALLSQWPDIEQVGEVQRPGIVHRLDKETSGILLIARTSKAYRWYITQFKSHKAKKLYKALVDGHPPTPEGRVEVAIGRDSKHRQKMAAAVEGQGRAAITEYYRVRQFKNHELLDVYPLTGRTHQIRVHMAFLGCPVVGDRIYGFKKPSIPLDRFFLHAQQLEICLLGETHPLKFQAKFPTELNSIIDKLTREEEVSDGLF